MTPLCNANCRNAMTNKIQVTRREGEAHFARQRFSIVSPIGSPSLTSEPLAPSSGGPTLTTDVADGEGKMGTEEVASDQLRGSCWWPVVGCQSLVASCWLPVVGCQLLVASKAAAGVHPPVPQQVASCLLSVVRQAASARPTLIASLPQCLSASVPSSFPPSVCPIRRLGGSVAGAFGFGDFGAGWGEVFLGGGVEGSPAVELLGGGVDVA